MFIKAVRKTDVHDAEPDSHPANIPDRNFCRKLHH